MADKKRLNLGRKNPANAENLDTVSQTDLMLNILATLQAIAGGIEGIAVELSDIKDNSNRELLKSGLLTELDIEERENGEDEEEGEDN